MAPSTALHTEQFDTTARDCTTAVMLKILDGKCKMAPEQQQALMILYDEMEHLPGALFADDTHRAIALARKGMDDGLAEWIHSLRLYAEASIPKPVMKAYKAVLRQRFM